MQTDQLLLAKRADLMIVKKKESDCRIVDFDQRVKLKESEKRDKYLHLARELKSMEHEGDGNIPIVIGALDTVTKALVQGLVDLEITGRVETIQTTAEYKEEFRRLKETCCHPDSCEKPSANAGVKNSQMSKIMNRIWGSYPSTEMQSVYSTTPADKAMRNVWSIWLIFTNWLSA